MNNLQVYTIPAEDVDHSYGQMTFLFSFQTYNAFEEDVAAVTIFFAKPTTLSKNINKDKFFVKQSKRGAAGFIIPAPENSMGSKNKTNWHKRNKVN